MTQQKLLCICSTKTQDRSWGQERGQVNPGLPGRPGAGLGGQAAHRQHILGDDDRDIIEDEAVPQHELGSCLLLEQGSAEEQQVEAGQQVPQPKNADAGGPCDKHHHKHQPEQVAEDGHLQHIQIGPGKWGYH